MLKKLYLAKKVGVALNVWMIYNNVWFFSYYSNLRIDTLGQILTMGNVRANSTVMVVESCLGLITGAVLERLGGKYWVNFGMYVVNTVPVIILNQWNFCLPN